MNEKPKYWLTTLVAVICTIPAFLFGIAVIVGGASLTLKFSLLAIIALIWFICVGLTFALEYDENH